MQSNAARIAVVALSVAVLVVLFVVLSGGDDEDGDTVAEPGTTTSTELPADRREGRPEKERERPRDAGPQVQALVVVGGEPRDGVADLEFGAGEQVRFDVRSDVAEEIHVHGYDLYADLEPGKTTEVRFPAELEGVFEVELHGSGAPLAELTVEP
jgi:hypothetical protein